MVMMIGPIASVAATENAPASASIPTQLISYINQQSAIGGCASGTTEPFRITSTNCPVANSTNSVPATNYVAMGTHGYVQSSYDTSTNYALWNAFSTIPPNPSSTYSYPSSVAYYWIGLSDSSGGVTFLMQAGWVYGSDGSSDSHHPYLFSEFYESSGTCNKFCGGWNATAPGDSVYFEVRYLASTTRWLMYAQDSTANTFSIYYRAEGAGAGQIPLTSAANAYVDMEGRSVDSSSDWPSATVTFTSLDGQTASGTAQLGAFAETWTTGTTSDLPFTSAYTTGSPTFTTT
jgi:hypothetical protein